MEEKDLEIMQSETPSLFAIVKNAIDAADPAGFLLSGAPEEEYELEAKLITRRLTHDMDKNQIASVMAEIFNSYINEEYTAKDFYDVAESIAAGMRASEQRNAGPFESSGTDAEGKPLFTIDSFSVAPSVFQNGVSESGQSRRPKEMFFAKNVSYSYWNGAPHFGLWFELAIQSRENLRLMFCDWAAVTVFYGNGRKRTYDISSIPLSVFKCRREEGSQRLRFSMVLHRVNSEALAELEKQMKNGLRVRLELSSVSLVNKKRGSMFNIGGEFVLKDWAEYVPAQPMMFKELAVKAVDELAVKEELQEITEADSE